LKSAIRKASEVITVTAGFYREITLSALTLIPRRERS